MSDGDLTNPDAAQAFAKVRRLMLIASVTTFVAIGAVFAVIGYRVFHSGGSAPAKSDLVGLLPAGARVLSTSIGEGRIAVSIELNGKSEVLLFDLATLKPSGVIRPHPSP